MPRLTTKQYLKAHKYLRRLWLNHTRVYSYLNPTQQWQLHDFFRPDEELTTEELLQHRKDITAKRPSLPHQAGRAMKELQLILDNKAMPRGQVYTMSSGRSRKQQRIRVRSIVRPQIDYKRLARALVELERQKSEGQDS